MVTWPHALQQSVMVAGHVAEEQILLTAHRQQKAKEGWGTSYPQGHAPGNLLPPARLHLLKKPAPPKIAPPVGDQVFT
jgi:hypothetical protein